MFSAPASLIRSREGVLAKFALDNLKRRRRRFFMMSLPNTTKASPKFSRKLIEKNGGEVVAFETYTTNDKDFSSQLTKIKQAAPELYFPAQLLQ